VGADDARFGAGGRAPTADAGADDARFGAGGRAAAADAGASDARFGAGGRAATADAGAGNVMGGAGGRAPTLDAGAGNATGGAGAGEATRGAGAGEAIGGFSDATSPDPGSSVRPTPAVPSGRSSNRLGRNPVHIGVSSPTLTCDEVASSARAAASRRSTTPVRSATSTRAAAFAAGPSSAARFPWRAVAASGGSATSGRLPPKAGSTPSRRANGSDGLDSADGETASRPTTSGAAARLTCAGSAALGAGAGDAIGGTDDATFSGCGSSDRAVPSAACTSRPGFDRLGRNPLHTGVSSQTLASGWSPSSDPGTRSD
jgi:hypothetical protein